MLMNLLVELERPHPFAEFDLGSPLKESIPLFLEGFDEIKRSGREPGIHPMIRITVYNMIQTQSRTYENGAVYNELKCGIHGGLLGNRRFHAPNNNEPVTLTCGHTFCRGCLLGPPLLAAYPTCGANIILPVAAMAPTANIKKLVSERLKPIGAAVVPAAPLVAAHQPAYGAYGAYAAPPAYGGYPHYYYGGRRRKQTRKSKKNANRKRRNTRRN